MQITPITTNFVPRHNNIKFTGDFSYEDVVRAREEGRDEWRAKGREEGFIIGSMLLGIISAIGIGVTGYNDLKKSEQTLQKVENIYNSYDIQKDTFTVKDMTGDDNPDLILYKKDGSKVVVDMANTKILEETTTTKLSPIDSI